MKQIFLYGQKGVHQELVMESRQCYRCVSQMFENLFKNIKGQIQRQRKKSKWNWPELHLYCGVCDLKTGLYIRSVFSVIIYALSLVINAFILYNLVKNAIILCSLEISDVETYFGVNFTEVKVERVKVLYTVMISYMMFWILFRVVHVAGIFFTVYAVYKKKPKILKYIFYINAINWVLGIFISLFGTLFLQVWLRVLLVLCVLFEGYNLMALNSEYKQMRGKSKLLMNLTNADVETEIVVVTLPPESSQPVISDQTVLDSQKHCGTCRCHEEPISPTNSAASVTDRNISNENTSDLNQNLPLDTESEKEPNIKDMEIIFNQDLLEPQGSPILEVSQCVNETLVSGANGQRATRPRTLQLPPYPEEKIDIVDIPTIYDEDQLNFGGSPVVENQSSPRLPHEHFV